MANGDATKCASNDFPADSTFALPSEIPTPLPRLNTFADHSQATSNKVRAQGGVLLTSATATNPNAPVEGLPGLSVPQQGGASSARGRPATAFAFPSEVHVRLPPLSSQSQSTSDELLLQHEVSQLVRNITITTPNVKNEGGLSGLRLEQAEDVEDSTRRTIASSPSVRESLPEIGSLPVEPSTPSLGDKHDYSGLDEVSGSSAGSLIHPRQVCVTVLSHD